MNVEKTGKRYIVQSESVYEASPQALFAVLLDYENFDRVSSVFKDSRYVEPADDGTPRAYTMVEGCVVFFCKSIERIDRLIVKPFTEIVAESEPNPADFRYSRSQWRFETAGEATTIYYRMEMEPGFWVPPVIGPYYIKRVLKAGGSRAVSRIETLARGEEPVL